MTAQLRSRLVNVRLDADRLRKAKALRQRGLTLSEVMREAIDDRFAELRRTEERVEASVLVRQLFDRYPDPPDLPARDYDVHDRRAAREAILRKLRRREP